MLMSVSPDCNFKLTLQGFSLELHVEILGGGVFHKNYVNFKKCLKLGFIFIFEYEFLHTCTYVQPMQTLCLGRTKVSIRSPGVGVKNSSKLL